MIPLRYGRRDAENPEQCAPEGRLPGGRASLHQLLGKAEQHAPERCHSHDLGHCLMLLHSLQLGWPPDHSSSSLAPARCRAGGLLQPAGAAWPLAEQCLCSQQQSLNDVWSSCPAAGEGPFPDGAERPGDHLRKVFYRMGFNDQEIVALSGGPSGSMIYFVKWVECALPVGPAGGSLGCKRGSEAWLQTALLLA